MAEGGLQAGSRGTGMVHPKVVFVKDSLLGRDFIFEDIGSWIKSPLALDRMARVMSGEFYSRRHVLFLDKKERDNCSADTISELYRLSNPGFLGECGVEDVNIDRYLKQVFDKNFDYADPRLRLLNQNDMVTSYVMCVLMPEALIYKYQLSGFSRMDAEAKFLEVKIDAEERESLIQEQKETLEKGFNDTSGEEDAWTDHSDHELDTTRSEVEGPDDENHIEKDMEIDMQRGVPELYTPLRGRFSKDSGRNCAHVDLERGCSVRIKRMIPKIQEIAIRQHNRRSNLNKCDHMVRGMRRYFGSFLNPSRFKTIAGLMTEMEARESLAFLNERIERMFRVLRERRLSMKSKHFFSNSFIKRLLSFSLCLCKKKNIITRLHPKIGPKDMGQRNRVANGMSKLSESFKFIDEERRFFGAFLRGEKFVAIINLLNKADCHSVEDFIVKYIIKVEKLKRDLRRSPGVEGNPICDIVMGKIAQLSDDLYEKSDQMYLLKFDIQK